MKRSFQLLLLTAISALLASSTWAQEEEGFDEELFQWAASLVQRAVVIDGHCDTVSPMVRNDYDITVRNDRNHIDIPRMMEGGMNGQFFASYVSPGRDRIEWVPDTLRMIDALHQVAAKDDRFVIASGAEDILKAKMEGKVACLPAIEGGHVILADLGILRMYHRLGVRYVTLTWNNSNEWADASDPDQSNYGNFPSRGGLTEFGKDVIREMNHLGMIIDLSHSHEDTFWDVMEVSTKPVIASHSCCWALTPVHRNLKDEQLKALAENGGVVGINYFAGFLSKDYNKKIRPVYQEMRAQMAELREKYKDDREAMEREQFKLYHELREKLPRVPLSDLIDHFDHAVKVAGIDHVGLGSDFDGISSSPDKLDDVSDIVWIVYGLKRRGYSEEDIRKILGENFLRVIRAAVGH